jgi:hypothetical protein
MKHTVLLLLLSILPDWAWAGAWVQPEGATFLSLTTTLTSTQHYFDEDSSLRSRGGHFTKYELAAYGEHGLTERDTVSLKVPLQRLTDTVDGSSSAGLADLEVGWRRLLWSQGGAVLSSQLLALVPTGYRLDDPPALGYDRLGIEPSLLAGYGFQWAGRPGFVEAQMGLRAYAGYPSEQIRALLAGGYEVLPWLTPIATVELHHALGTGEDRQEGDATIITNYTLLKGTLGCIIPVYDGLRLTAGWQQHLWGKVTGRDGGPYVGLWLYF